jgi:hypothetical protein
MASYRRCYLGRIRRFQLRARLGSPSHFSIPCLIKPYVRFSIIRLSCSLRNKAYPPIGLELLSDRDTVFGSHCIIPISCISLPYSTASNQSPSGFSVFTLLYIFRLSSCSPMEGFLILPCLTSVERSKIQ